MDSPRDRIEYEIMGRIDFPDDRMPLDLLYRQKMEEETLDLRHPSEMASQILSG